MKRFLAVSLMGLSLMAGVLAACEGLPGGAEVEDATKTVAPAITAAPTNGVQPTVVEPTEAGTPIVSHGGPVVDYVSLVDTLRAGGAKVDPAGQITQPFFTPAGQAIKVNGGDVQVFEYADKSSADSEAGKVAPDGGSVGTSMVSWVGVPHFYNTVKIIVLYVGSDASIIGAIVKAVGPQFAGR